MTLENMFNSVDIERELQTEKSQKVLTSKLKKQRRIEKTKAITAAILSAGITLGTSGYALRSLGNDLLDKIATRDNRIRTLEYTISNLKIEKNNLITLNEQGITQMQSHLNNMEKQLPGIGSLLPDFDYFIDGVEKFLKNPRKGSELELLLSTPDYSPEDLNEAKYNYLYELHGLQNYLPSGTPTVPNLIPPVVDIEHALVTSDMGNRDYYLYYGNGKEKLLLKNQYHNGVDIIHPDLRLIANKKGTVLVFEDVDLLSKGDYIKDHYGGLGQLLVVLYEIKGEDGTNYGRYQEFYGHLDKNSGIEWKDGDTVYPGDLLGIMGSSGFSTGIHLHWMVFRQDEETKRWPAIDPFTVRTYTDQRVYFREYNLPESLERFK